MFNISYTRNGGIRFLRIHRLTIQASVMTYATWERNCEKAAMKALVAALNKKDVSADAFIKPRKARGKLDVFGIAACAVFAASIAVAAINSPNVELQVETWDGEMYIAGVGTTCADAFKGAVFPENWRRLACVTKFM